MYNLFKLTIQLSVLVLVSAHLQSGGPFTPIQLLMHIKQTVARCVIDLEQFALGIPSIRRIENRETECTNVIQLWLGAKYITYLLI